MRFSVSRYRHYHDYPTPQLITNHRNTSIRNRKLPKSNQRVSSLLASNMSSYSIDEIHNSNHNYDNASHAAAAASAVGDAHMADYVALGWSVSSYTQEADDGTVTVVPGQFLLLVGIAFLLGLGKGGVPGLATIATALTVTTAPMFIPGGLQYAVALQNPILTMIDIAAAYLHWHAIVVSSITILVPFAFVGLLVGHVLEQHLSDAQARILVGGFLLLLLTIQVVPKYWTTTTTNQKTKNNSKEDQDDDDDEDETGIILDPLIEAERGRSGEGDSGGIDDRLRRRSPAPDNNTLSTYTIITNGVVGRGINNDETRNTNINTNTTLNKKTMTNSFVGWASIVGIVGGAATMLTNAMGPILNIYLLSVRKLSPTAYIGTRALFFCVLNCGKLPIRYLSGTLGLSMLPLAVVLGGVSVLGVVCAKPLLLRMNTSYFVTLELAVVAFSGLRLCYMGYVNG